MNRKTRRFLTGIIMIAVLTLGTSFSALAARIAFSDRSVTTGDTVSINMKITSTGTETIGRADVTLSYDPSLLEFVSGDGASGGAGTVRVTGSSDSESATEMTFVLQFRALRSGDAKITIASQEVYDKDSQTVTVEKEGSSAITIAAAAGDSTNADLAGLQVSPGTLSPAFSADTTEYTVSVGGDVTELIVDAPAVDAGASVTVDGNANLQVGENKVVCTVTAQDGQTVKTYTITVTKVEGAQDGEGGDAQSDGVILRTPERSVTVYPVTDDIPIPEGFVPARVSIDGSEVQGWIWGADGENPQYCVFYASNENGESDFYRYDLTEKTLQRYFRDPLVNAAGDSEYEKLVDQYNSLLTDYNMRFYIIIGLIVLAVILLIVIIALVATRGGKDDFYEKRQDGGNYPERHKSSERQKQAASQSENRRISREERYMRGMEEEEEAAEQQEFRAEQQIRERQAQRRQQAQQPQRPAGASGQHPAGSPQQGQRPAGGQQQGQRTAGSQQQGQRSSGVRPTGQNAPQGRPSQAGRQAQQTSGQASQSARRPQGQSGDQNYVVRGPIPGDEEPTQRNVQPRGSLQDPSRRPQTDPQKPKDGGDDDDFQIIDIGV